MNTRQMKLSILGATALLLPLSLHAQTEGNGSPMSTQPGSQNSPGSTSNQSTPGMTNPHNSAASRDGSGESGTDTGTMRDKMFLKEAAQGGMAEVKLGQLASQKGNSDDVKQFGQKMVDDHTTLNNDMKPIAESMGVSLPTSLSKKDQAEYDKLDGMSGAAFDKEYLSYMRKDHHKDSRDFHQEASTTQNATLKEAVTKGEKVIQEHTKMVDRLAATKGASAGSSAQ